MIDLACIDRHDDDGTPADVGRLCADHFSRMRSRLLELTAIATWLEVNVAAAGAPDERVSGSREDPIPLRLDVLDLIGPDSRRPVAAASPVVLLWEDGLCVGVFATWQEAIAVRWDEIVAAADVDVDVHRWRVAVTDKRGCDQAGADALRAVVDYWARRVCVEGRFPWTDRNDLVGLVGYVAQHLRWVAEQDWAPELAADVTAAGTAAHRMAPWREEIRRDTAPCPSCNRATVVQHIARGLSRCEPRAGGCGRTQPLSEYVLATVLPATRRAG